MSTTSNNSDAPKTSPSVSLVLGSGGARGLAHIGAIRAIEEAGYRIESIAGCSMGALVGGVHAAGKLDSYADWVTELQQSDVLRLVDWTLSGGGLIRGERIMKHLSDLIGDVDIESMEIDFTAVAVDIEQGREIWLTRGSLFEAIRSSIAIPGLFTPHRYMGRLMVDGGILNPIPVAPTLRCLTDRTFVVNVNGNQLGRNGSARNTMAADDEPGTPDDEGMLERIRGFFDDRIGRSGRAEQPGLVAMMMKSLEIMETVITRQHLAVFQPDLVIEIPRNACMIHEFHRARELIELGHARTIEALKAQRKTHD